MYALSIPEVYKTWRWTEQYPGAKELQEYFRHVDKCIDVSKDTLYHTRVSKARWNEQTHKWDIECNNGTRISATYMHCCLGFAAKRHFPDWEGLDTFKGYMCHSSFWPEDGVDVKGKRVGVIGNGATGVQIAQTTAREAGELKVFIRTPNTCLPMNQGAVDRQQMEKDLDNIHHILTVKRMQNIAGFLYDGTGRAMLGDEPEQREELMKESFDEGGFRPLFLYADMLIDEKVGSGKRHQMSVLADDRMPPGQSYHVRPLGEANPGTHHGPSEARYSCPAGALTSLCGQATLTRARLLRANGQAARETCQPKGSLDIQGRP